MKKYFVEENVICNDGRKCHNFYECEKYELARHWAGNAIRLENVNTFEEGKRKIKRKQLARGKYITIEKMNHWISFDVIVFDNETKNIIEIWKG